MTRRTRFMAVAVILLALVPSALAQRTTRVAPRMKMFFTLGEDIEYVTKRGYEGDEALDRAAKIEAGLNLLKPPAQLKDLASQLIVVCQRPPSVRFKHRSVVTNFVDGWKNFAEHPGSDRSIHPELDKYFAEIGEYTEVIASYYAEKPDLQRKNAAELNRKTVWSLQVADWAIKHCTDEFDACPQFVIDDFKQLVSHIKRPESTMDSVMPVLNDLHRTLRITDAELN